MRKLKTFVSRIAENVLASLIASIVIVLVTAIPLVVAQFRENPQLLWMSGIYFLLAINLLLIYSVLQQRAKRKKEIKGRVDDALDFAGFNFDESSPDRVILRIRNRGASILPIVNAKFLSTDLHLSAAYQKEGVYHIIPLEQAYLPPGERTLDIELRLATSWGRSEIDRTKGSWGFLTLTVHYEGELVERLIMV